MKIINPSIEILTETTYSSMLNRLEQRIEEAARGGQQQ